ncbi:MAG: TIR domain-containing protein [Pseudonocardiaceae bacterium]
MASVFISHASVDKALVVQQLVSKLQDRRHRVWYDTESISIIDSIPLKISEGLASSDYAIIAVSEAYRKSRWCKRELAATVMGQTTEAKKLIVIQLDDANVPEIISDIYRIKVTTKDHHSITSAIQKIVEFFDREVAPAWVSGENHRANPVEQVSLLLEADRVGNYGSNLLSPASVSDQTRPENEGLILIKPGGTFNEPCLQEILSRVSRYCRVRQLRLFNGALIAHRKLFEQQYSSSAKIATGDIELTSEDWGKIRDIYDSPEFFKIHGVPYSDELIVPALTLTSSHTLRPEEVSELWERGRLNGLFHNKRPDGLNKIGYQKSVFPINVAGIGIRLVLNGFIPGYRQLFISDHARIVAIHASTSSAWQLIRDELVGGDSDPVACAIGSIRRDATERKLPLDPADDLVNGQRNVCHSSATLFDGMRELCMWFEYDQSATVLGQICELAGLKSETLEKLSNDDLPDFSWFTRNDDLAQLYFDVRLRVAKDDLLGDAKFRERVLDYARRVDDQQELEELISRNPGFAAFVEEGLRLNIGGEELYRHAVSSTFRAERDRSTFLEVAREIREIAKSQPGLDRAEIVAAAYRIAAGDIKFLNCEVYDSVDSPQLFRATAISELAEQALQCGIRTENNLIRDVRAYYANGRYAQQSVNIGESEAWSEFMDSAGRFAVHSPIVAVILAGGRSTRMASTIPKPILPFRNKLLLRRVEDSIRSATSGKVDVFAAVGFRENLVKRAIGGRVRYLTYRKTLGLGFRLATALEELSEHEGLILVAYSDMPEISISTFEKLVNIIDGRRTFGLVESQSDLSGHIVRHTGEIQKIVQSRLRRAPGPESMRDVGVYAFYNTQEFRSSLLTLKNDNVRSEYIFPDIVETLARCGWKIKSVRERPELAHGINTSSDLLSLACGLDATRRGGHAEISAMRKTLAADYYIDSHKFTSVQSLRAAVNAHIGPAHFFEWWDALWS